MGSSLFILTFENTGGFCPQKYTSLKAIQKGTLLFLMSTSNSFLPQARPNTGVTF